MKRNGSIGMFAGALGLAGLFSLGACDPSKDALDATKTQLTSITSERDQLKSQLSTIQQQLTSITSERDQLKTQLADAQTHAAAVAVPADAAHPAEHHEAHHLAPAAAAAVEAAKPAEVKKQEAVTTGAGHFNR